ncbi:MAG: exosortase family protein XrtG [Firmicutes bacterium]|jgi:exosortase family protein XrtG|nr:exosortase family protein XrtG [Bacillota bacterium]
MSRTLIAIVIAWAASYLVLRRARAWLLSYVVGAVGFTLISVYIVRGSSFETLVEVAGARLTHYICNMVGVPTKVFTNAPGTLLVLIVYQVKGWTAVEMDIECSGMLEMAVFSGLVLFFEGFSYARRLGILASGLALTYASNVLRVMIIVLMIHRGGKSAIYLAHTVVGRAVFFAMIISLYWYAFTKPTLELIRRRLAED